MVSRVSSLPHDWYVLRGLPGGTVTFLFTDVEGSTRLLEELGDEVYGEALAEHRRVIREACAAHGGVEVDTQGDAFFVAFPSAPGALAAAAELTAGLRAGRIRVRVGLHTGTPVVGEEGYVGSDVHRAARIAAAGHGGQVLVSASTAALVNESLRDLGEHRLKDLSAPERVFQLGEMAFPPLRSLYRTNLPVPATVFLGRERELATVVDLLGSSGARLVTLTGPGGIGKTRLALQAAAEVSDAFVDGVYWLPFAAIREGALVIATIASSVGVVEQAGRSPLESLVKWLAGKRLLLVLDNAEHLMPSFAADVSTLLAAAPGLVILVTTRERLRVAGEQLYAVPTLATADAVELFLSHARSTDPEFADSPAVHELCARLDHLPLALELAAARIGLLTPVQLLDRLGRRLDLLKGGRDSDPRQRTLRETIAWSYDLLGPEEQQAFARLSVFAGGCTLQAAEEVCRADIDTLESLLDRSLIRRHDTDQGPRLWMLETIREFAAERLAESDDPRLIARRQLEWCLVLAREVDSDDDREFAPSRLDEERDNMRVAFAQALASDPPLALELASLLGRYWIRRGQYHEGRTSLDEALARAPHEATPSRARAFRMLGMLAIRQADLAAADDALQEALGLYRQQDNHRETGYTLNQLGIVAWYRGDLPEATRLLEESLAEHDAGGNPHDRLGTLGNLAAVANASGDHARAVELGREIVAEAGEDESSLLGNALNNLGLALEALGKTDEAQSSFERSLALCRLDDITELLPYALASLAHVLVRSDPSKASDLYGESLQLMRETGDLRGTAYCLEGLALLAAETSEHHRAALLLAAAAALRERTGAVLDAIERAEVDATAAYARDSLGAEAFRSAWNEGTRLSPDQTAALIAEGQPAPDQATR